jgi:hypothetical protein
MQASFSSRVPAFTCLLLTALLTLPALAAPGDGREAVGPMRAFGAAVDWQVAVDNERVVLTVTGPGGFAFSKEFPAGTTPSFRLSDIPTKSADGTYSYELRAVPRVSEAVRKALADARAADDSDAANRIMRDNGLDNPVVQSGAFTISGGSFVQSGAREAAYKGTPRTGTDAVKAPIAPNDQVIADDLIVQGSLCVGFDCVNNEGFGVDTIRLKENNLRILFMDTSTSAGFPTTDWQLTANDQASGGANKFSIEDITDSKVPFTIIGAAPTNSIFVDSTGRLGLRTATPSLDVHISTSNTPAMRYEQTNAGGFTAQTWDIGANEANFFVRDVTGGSRLPLRIRPGAPTSSIDINASGDIGIGTASPQNRLDMRAATATSDLFASMGTDPTNGPSFNFGYAGLSFGRSAAFYNVRPDASAVAPNPSMRWDIANVQYMILDNEGFLGLGSTMTNPQFPIHHESGARLSGGNWTNASSYTVKQDIALLDTKAAFDALACLEPVTYEYKTEPNDQQVGFIAEDVPDLVATPDHRALSAMDIVAVLTKVVKEQQATIEQLQHRLTNLEKKN